MNSFFLEKTSPSPTLPFCMKTRRQVHESYYSRISSASFRRNLRQFLKISTVVVQVDKICFSNFVDLPRSADLPRLKLQPSVASTKIFLRLSDGAPCPFLTMMIPEKFSTIYTEWEYAGKPLDIHFLEIIMRTFWWESLRGWDFSRPQLVVVSGLFGGNPLMDGIFLGHNLLLSQAFSVGIPWWMGFF
jgi:hypothetical protein